MSNEIRSEISGRTTQPNQGALSFEVVEAAALPAAHYGALLDLCTRAYEKHFAPYLEPLVEPTHILAYYEDVTGLNVVFRGSTSRRITWSIIVVVIMFVLTIVLAMVDSSEC